MNWATPLTRRQLLITSAVGLIAASCSDGSNDSAADTTPPTNANTAAPNTATPTSTVAASAVAPVTTADSVVTTDVAAFPRTVTHGLGETQLARQPQRVVATADRDQLDVLLAMGVVPVQYGRSGDYQGAPPWIDSALVEGIEAADMADPFLPNLELIASARPDLILDAWADPATHESLASIAPTVQIKTDITDSWESAQRLAGEACGTEPAAEQAIAATKAVLAEHAERLADHHDKRVAVAFVLGDQLGMLNGTDIGGRIVNELGFDVVPTPDGISGNYSLEAIPDLLGDADIILSFDYGGLDDQIANPLFAALPAVQNGGYVSVPTDVASACYQESTMSLLWAAPYVAAALESAANGEGIKPPT